MSKYSVEIPVGVTVWKKIILSSRMVPCNCSTSCTGIATYEYGITELEVLEGGLISTYEDDRNKKGRVAAARVVSITSMTTNEPVESGYSSWDPGFKYTVGAVVRPNDEFDSSYSEVCASGIHCFLDKKDAERYVL